MNSEKEVQLISQLAHELRPVKRWFSPLSRTIIAVLFVCLPTAFCMNMISPFWMQPLKENWIVGEFFLMLAMLSAGLFLNFKAVVPGEKPTFKIFYVLLGLVILSFVCRPFFVNTVSETLSRHFCEIEVFFYSTISAITILFVLKKGTFSASWWPIPLSVLFVGGLSSGLMHLFCSSDLKHVFLFHFSPVIISYFFVLFVFHKIKL